MNLTGLKSMEEVIVKHFLDSAMATIYVDFKGKKIADVGSGAGFPGLAIKLLEETTFLSLIEAAGKKAGFLSHVASKLNLTEVEVVRERAETVGGKPERRGKYDVVVARAVSRLNTLSEYCLPLVAEGAFFVAWKGPNASAEIEEAANALKVLGGEVARVVEFTLPIFNEGRTLVFIKKVKSTPPSFPRRVGVPGKRPL